MTCLICPDESEFQPIITDKFGRRLLILRAAFGAHYQDAHFLANTAIIAWLYRHKLIDGVILYQVFLSTATPAEHYAFLWKLIGPTVPDWLVGIMLDVESWRGTSYPVSGDHSRSLNTLYGLHAHRMGSWTACGLYGNRSDLAEIAPHRDTRAWVIVASYGPRLVYKSVKGAIGQQYTDGQARWGTPKLSGSVLPRSTSGITCDHNVFDPARFPTAAKLRAFMRPDGKTPAPAPKPPAKPPVRAGHYASLKARSVLVSPDQNTALYLGNDGALDVRTAGHHARTL